MSIIKVLLVEDDPGWLSIFNTIVGNHTKDLFEYTHVSDLNAALIAVKNESFGLILLDLILPDSEAVNTIQTISTHAKYIPIVVMTTLDDEKLMQKAFQAGVDDYIIKDQYDLKTFIHVSRQSIRRFMGRATRHLAEDIKKLLVHLQSVDANLEKWQQELNDNEHI